MKDSLRTPAEHAVNHGLAVARRRLAVAHQDLAVIRQDRVLARPVLNLIRACGC